MVKQRSPLTRVVLLSARARQGHVLQALRNGAEGVVGPQSTATDLVRALQTVMAGRRYLGAGLAEADVLAPSSADADPYDSLTAREREVVHLAAEGWGNTEIAQRLGVSPRTVETHRAHAMHKLGLRIQPDLIRYALRRGLLVSDEDGA
jgi:DNA-binding NarL/FixJ family response regulator